MSIKFTSVPPKPLAQSILSSATSFRLTNILGWDGVALTSADFGTQAFGAFLSADRTILELFEYDPATIANSSITILYRGLKFNGTQTTEVTANKRDWTAGDTTVQLGSDIPQLISLLGALGNTNAWTGANSFALLPTSTGGNAVSGTQLITYAQALAMATGTASIDRVVVDGTAGETLAAGNLVYIKIADGRWWKCDADTAATVDNIIMGIAQGSGTAGNPVTNGVLLFGLDTNQTGLTTNTAYYASNTAGAISSSVGTVEVSVGISQSTTSIIFYPRYNQQLTEDQQDALLGNNGTPSNTNKYVTQTGFQIGAELYAADAGANDTYVITLSPVPVAYVTGMTIRFKANTVNTGAATINVNALGAKTIVKYVNTTLADGDIAAGQFCTLIYDGTNFVLQNPVARVLTYANGVTTKDLTSGGTQNIAHGLGVIPKKVRITTSVWLNTSNANPVSMAVTAYNGTTQSSIYFGGRINTTTVNSINGSGTAMLIGDDGNYQSGVVTFDATNIIITWTETGTAINTAQIMWEAEA